MDTVAPVSTPVQVAVKAVPSLAGSGSTVQTAAAGGVLSKVKPAGVVAVLPASSVAVAVSSPSTPAVPTVPVQDQLPEPLSVQAYPGIVKVAPASTPVQLAVTTVPLLAGSGVTVQVPMAGGVLSKVNGTLDVAVLPAASAVVAVASPETWPGPVPAVAVHTTWLPASAPQE